MPAATTATDTLAANPNGTLTLNRTVVPVRKQIAGVWTPLDATLQPNPDGSLSPKVATSDLRLSGGGNRSLAQMTRRGGTLGLDLPFSLPVPTLSGATATYPNVLPDVDLQVTATDQGGFSEVLVVRTAQAAANPLVRQLAMPLTISGLTISADVSGNLKAADRTGQAVFAANAPMMWDAAVPAAPGVTAQRKTAGGAMVRVDPGTGAPVDSSAAGPGVAAHTAPIDVTVGGNTLTLTPDAGLLGATSTVFPVFIDPSWNPVAGAYATVTSLHSATNYWNSTPDPDGHLQVGHNSSINSRTLLNFPINVGSLSGATISSATLYLFEVYASDCTARQMNIYAPSTTLSSGNANWNTWNGVNWGSAVGSASTQTGYNSSCPNGTGVGADVTGAVIGAVNAGRTVQTFGLRTSNESDLLNYKEFLASGSSAPSMSIVYNHPPNTPSGLRTSPVTTCAGTPTTVGDGLVSLYAPVSDPDGGNVGVAFKIWRTSDGQVEKTSDPAVLTAASGTTAVLQVPELTLKTASGSVVTSFSWAVYVTDGSINSAWSTTCTFNFDPTRPGTPVVTRPASPAMGQAATFTIAKPVTGAVPSAYMYQLNGGAPQQESATSGNATITVTPERFTNVLTVTGLSAGNNVGETASVVFDATPPATPRADQDITGDGYADLVAGGAANGLPAGIWLATGRRTGAIVPATTDIGVNGAGINAGSGISLPSDFNGAQVLTGHFTGTALQDVGAYYPTGPAAGQFIVVTGTGNSSPMQGQNSNYVHRIPAGGLQDRNGDSPLQLVNVGNGSGQTTPYPDLMAISGDPTSGYYLDYYVNRGETARYEFPATLMNATPTGGVDWNNWIISSAQTPSGSWLFLWNKTTGRLYLWKNPTFDTAGQALTYTQYTLATNWNVGADITLRAADVDRDSNPDLWSIDSTGIVTPWLVSGLTSTPTLTARPAQSMTTTAHNWLLNDKSNGVVTAATDGAGTLNLTGDGAAAWHSGDLFNPDVQFDGSSATLTSTTTAVTTDANFTLSAWVKPDNNNHAVILSQDGAPFWLYIDTDHSWRFAMTRSDHVTWDIAAAAANSVTVGVWTHLTASFQQSTNTISLAVNDQTVATSSHSSTWQDTSKFRVGAGYSGGGPWLFFSGQVAAVETRSSLLTPVSIGQLGSADNASGNLDNVITTIDLTRQGMTDWASWGQSDASSYDHKSSGQSQITNPTANGQPKTRSSGGATLAWSDGTPSGPVTNAGNGVAAAGLGSDLQFTAPAGITTRVLRIYAAVTHTTGILTAKVSDGSGTYISNSLSSPTATATGVFTIAYRAKVPNQVLTVTWQASTFIDPTSSIALQGATLQQAQFDTSLEAGQTQLTWTDTVDTGTYPHGGLTNVAGVCCGLPGPETRLDQSGPAHAGGTHRILYSGYDTSATTSFAYTKAFDLTTANVTVKPGTTLSYWIFPQSAANSGNLADGTNSTCVGIDLGYANNTSLRDSSATEQHGRPVHPANQCTNLTLDTWNFVSIDLGAASNGQTINTIDIGYDQPANQGAYRGFIDEITITG
ncbi:hypothetical protein GCM10020218_018230 [Dactylosporangium vinaceum]